MCPHDTFKIIYYDDGVMLRRCENCGQIDLRLDWQWQSLETVQKALHSMRLGKEEDQEQR